MLLLRDRSPSWNIFLNIFIHLHLHDSLRGRPVARLMRVLSFTDKSE
jgi:hypothetical protein